MWYKENIESTYGKETDKDLNNIHKHILFKTWNIENILKISRFNKKDLFVIHVILNFIIKISNYLHTTKKMFIF